MKKNPIRGRRNGKISHKYLFGSHPILRVCEQNGMGAPLRPPT